MVTLYTKRNEGRKDKLRNMRLRHRGIFRLPKKYLPRRRLPLVDGGAHQEDVVPELLQHLDLLAALLQQPELRDLHLEQRRRVLNLALEEDHDQVKLSWGYYFPTSMVVD